MANIIPLKAKYTSGNVTGLGEFVNTDTIPVIHGGTGKTSVTANAILYGAGTNTMVEVTGTTGQFMQLNGSGVPVFGNIDCGTL